MSSAPRSLLFVSGEKVERFPKALASGADAVCIDLEDAVLPGAKSTARAQAMEWIESLAGEEGASRVALRINGIRTVEGLRDVVRLAALRGKLEWLLLPKVESPVEVECARGWVGDRARGVVALLETPRGIERASEIADALGACRPGGGAAMMLGGADLSAELGVAMTASSLAWARGRLVNAACAAGVQAWDVPCLSIDDPRAVESETRASLAIGFCCKAAIHPVQIPAIHEAFAPDEQEIEWARELLGAQGAQGGAWVFRGRLVDAAVVRRARRVAELAAREPGRA